MKKSILKQSVIALVVGAAISGASVAADTNSLDNAANALKEAIKSELQAKADATKAEQDGKINTIKDVLVKALNGDGTNPGIIETLTDASNLANENKDKIASLASSTTESVDKLGDDISILGAALFGEEGDDNDNGLVGKVNDNAAAIAELRNSDAYRDLNTVRNLVEGANNKLDDHINNEFSDLVDAVGEIESTVEKNTSRITDTRNKQVLQNARLDNHSNRIGVNEAAIATNAAAVAENRKDIDKNASRITDTRNKQVLQNARLDNHSNRIGVNEAAIATNTAAIATNTAAVATNTAAVATNRASIAANTAAIATHNQRLDHLDNRVNKLDKDLKRGLAAQAALTGLFQPYTVGKVNFTAAVGGYKSQTAVAIGTGYRYNQNIATKAGVAFTQGGGVTYNAGVNFEW